MDATAAVTVAAGAATIVAGATSDGARGALGQAASAAGGALLNFAKELPWVAPIAFLVAGVVEAAANVHALKRDAQIFAANVQSVENVMVDAARKGHLSKVEETCMALQFEMEEGLAFCHKLKTQYFVTQMFMSGRDCQKFKDISDSMHRQVTIIAAAASIAVHDIVMEEYEQGAQLADKIAESGGPAAVAADPEKKAACQEFMTASDALLHGAVDEVQRVVRAEAAKSQKKMDMLMEQSRAQTKVLEDQVANLTKMMEVLLATRVGMSEGGAGVDLSRPDGRKAGVPGEEAPPPADDATVDRALETGITGDEIRDVMRRMPVADTEAERLEVVDKYGLNTDEITDLIGDEDLRAITDEGREAFGVTDCWVGTIDRTRQTYVSYAAEVDGVELPRGDGHWWPNIASACKHVIKKGDVLQSNGSIAENAMEHMANLSLPEYQALAEAGHAECKNVFPVIGQIMSDPEGKMPNEQLLEQEYNPHGEKGTTYGAARTFWAPRSCRRRCTIPAPPSRSKDRRWPVLRHRPNEQAPGCGRGEDASLRRARGEDSEGQGCRARVPEHGARVSGKPRRTPAGWARCTCVCTFEIFLAFLLRACCLRLLPRTHRRRRVRHRPPTHLS